MSLKIRLRQQGRKNRQTYRLVVTDIRTPRDGKYLEMLGWYNPFSDKKECEVNEDRIHFWIGQGAQLTPNSHALLARIAPNLINQLRVRVEEKRKKQVQRRRELRKAAHKSSTASA